MKQAAVVYWSGTGNTEAMAKKIAEGIESAGVKADIFTAADFSAAMADSYDAIAFGCPSMGAEQLEENEFEPMFESCKSKLNGKRIVLFGSYGWGDGEWMRIWEEECRACGAQLACACVICNEAPDEQAECDCKEAGRQLVS